MTLYAQHVSAKRTPQTESIPGKPMQANNAGGFSFVVDDWTRLDRFLILGADGGTYYVGERKLTIDNAACVLRCLEADGVRTVNRIVAISEAGRAPKNDPAVFALALAFTSTNNRVKEAASLALSKVCRIGTHLFQFVKSVNELRGWGRVLRTAVADWYLTKPAGKLAYQVTKYQQRDGWSHRDLLRLSHPRATGLVQDVLHWCVKGWEDVGEQPHPEQALQVIWAMERAKRVTTADEIIHLIVDFGLVREHIPTQFLNDVGVWEALLNGMPLTAMIRNLGKMTAISLLKPLSKASRQVVETLADVEAIRRARLHPIALLAAQKVYSQGHGDKGSLTWVPDQAIVDALDSAFYLAFDAVEPAGKRFLLGVDVSGSMSAPIAGTSLSCCEAATALALVTTHSEPWTFSGRFNRSFEQLPFRRGIRLADALQYTRNVNCGGTDCSMPMVVAMERKLEVDTFVVLTDNETYAGGMHPCQALKKYRQQSGIPAKLIVVGMVASEFTIADPTDGGSLDVVGFDTATPAVVTDFARD